jgi:hypothetical protein
MPGPFVVPKISVRRIEGVSLKHMAESLTGGTNYVRVGLPDSTTTEAGNAIRAARPKKRRGKKP